MTSFASALAQAQEKVLPGSHFLTSGGSDALVAAALDAAEIGFVLPAIAIAPAAAGDAKAPTGSKTPTPSASKPASVKASVPAVKPSVAPKAGPAKGPAGTTATKVPAKQAVATKPMAGQQQSLRVQLSLVSSEFPQ
jgi:hypothetical protein